MVYILVGLLLLILIISSAIICWRIWKTKDEEIDKMIQVAANESEGRSSIASVNSGKDDDNKDEPPTKLCELKV